MKLQAKRVPKVVAAVPSLRASQSPSPETSPSDHHTHTGTGSQSNTQGHDPVSSSSSRRVALTKIRKQSPSNTGSSQFLGSGGADRPERADVNFCFGVSLVVYAILVGFTVVVSQRYLLRDDVVTYVSEQTASPTNDTILSDEEVLLRNLKKVSQGCVDIHGPCVFFDAQLLDRQHNCNYTLYCLSLLITLNYTRDTDTKYRGTFFVNSHKYTFNFGKAPMQHLLCGGSFKDRGGFELQLEKSRSYESIEDCLATISCTKIDNMITDVSKKPQQYKRQWSKYGLTPQCLQRVSNKVSSKPGGETNLELYYDNCLNKNNCSPGLLVFRGCTASKDNFLDIVTDCFTSYSKYLPMELKKFEEWPVKIWKSCSACPIVENYACIVSCAYDAPPNDTTLPLKEFKKCCFQDTNPKQGGRCLFGQCVPSPF